ncbi:hypothetical protein AUJ66_00915 [Candidatus Desantisbacteria bacterium CG1_02_38_46]|uniref:Uncharacterized protein n=3 Tax=unclassified Candidatus Desantisiibacteriota TaxID=3106372 RepID=A0A2H9P9J9_9BACT|nr:MAG: hypothetical protein AUJ66_00915 [Candidatus Desantisbacteria bacterium CG1_02_38_46]PIU51487.1 MAG: hypothetical protein COS91_04210 [Candidatus Desantisbacteria bacterium CG07_land_8_20_14_0_80_39_15]PIZ14955.1 MAG: hypothetical protein COY51_06855 [Candidatus Desantisbacteria bacterium CG_4_10_14_0_8_um_filter_39_17]
MHEERIYRRDYITEDLKGFEVVVKETDLYICAKTNLSKEAVNFTLKYRTQIEEYIKKHPNFQTSLAPLFFNLFAPPIIKEMLAASRIAGVGPMASVAGAIAEFVGRDLLKYSDEVIIENGGDIFIKSQKKRNLGIYAGDSQFSNKLAIEIDGKKTPLGVCTSSGTVGPSLSFGKTDATVVISRSTALADACATAIGNMVNDVGDIKRALEFARKIKGVLGILIIFKDRLGAWGDVKIV